MSSKKKFAAGIAVAVVALAIAVILIFALNNQATSPANMLSLGERYLLEMQFEQALVQFLAVIEIEPMNVQAYLGAAEAFVGLGQIENAANILRQGLEQTGSEDIAWAWVALDPGNYQIYLTIANMLIVLANGELGARLGVDFLRSLAIDILRRGLERTGSEQVQTLLDELEMSAYTPSRENEDATGQNVDQPNNETDIAQPVNLTGMPPLSFQEIAEWGFPYGVTLYDVLGRYGLGLDHVDVVRDHIAQARLDFPDTVFMSYTARISPWYGAVAPPGGIYSISIRSDLRISHVTIPHDIRDYHARQMLRFAIGMSVQHAIESVAVSNPLFLNAAMNPSFENLVELGAHVGYDVFGNAEAVLVGASYTAADGTMQHLRLFSSRDAGAGLSGSTYRIIFDLINDGIQVWLLLGFNQNGELFYISFMPNQ